MLASRVLPSFVKVAPLLVVALLLFLCEPLAGDVRSWWWLVTVQMVLLLVAPVLFLVLLLWPARRG